MESWQRVATSGDDWRRLATYDITMKKSKTTSNDGLNEAELMLTYAVGAHW